MRLWSQLEIEVVPGQLIPKSESENSDYSRSQFSPVCEFSRWNLYLYVIIEMSPGINKKEVPQKTLTLDLTKYSWHGTTCPKVFKRDEGGGEFCASYVVCSEAWLHWHQARGTRLNGQELADLRAFLSFTFVSRQVSTCVHVLIDASHCTEYTGSKRKQPK